MSTKARFENNIKHTKQSSNAKQYIGDELKKLDRKKIEHLLNSSTDYFSNIYANLGLILETIDSKKDKDINNFFSDELNLIKNIELLSNDIEALTTINRNIKKEL